MQHQRQTTFNTISKSSGNVPHHDRCRKVWYQYIFIVYILQSFVHKGSVFPRLPVWAANLLQRIGYSCPSFVGLTSCSLLVALMSTSCCLLTLLPRLLAERPQTGAGKHIATGLMPHTQLKPFHFYFSMPNHHETSSDIFGYFLLFYFPVSVLMILGLWLE